MDQGSSISPIPSSAQTESAKETSSGIKSWSINDRPREKLLKRGKEALTDAELLAIIIGSGNREESAVGLMQRILKAFDDDLNLLGRKTVEELIKFKGIGEAKAISIVAMLELGRRRSTSGIVERPMITSSQDAYDLLVGDLIDLPYESFWVLMLDSANKVIKKECISTGGLGSVMVDAKIIFKKALDHRATHIIIAHNHPSGNNYPSKSDVHLTTKLAEGGRLLDIKVSDHIIIAGNQYFSFADEGQM